MRLAALLEGGEPFSAITAGLAELSVADRRAECLALNPGRQRRLWELASASNQAFDELVPGETAVFLGRNSLPLFSRFQKWLARDHGGLVGCNRHPLAPLIGPGYFTVRGGGTEQLRFDYGVVPAAAPAGWPAVKGNGGLLAKPVYGDLLDRLAWVTPDVLVGAAYRGEVPLDAYFVLVRDR